jgi:hypothetical protein
MTTLFLPVQKTPTIFIHNLQGNPGVFILVYLHMVLKHTVSIVACTLTGQFSSCVDTIT